LKGILYTHIGPPLRINTLNGYNFSFLILGYDQSDKGWSIGVVEYWSTGVLEHRKRLVVFPKQHLFCAIHMCPMLFIITP
jgi:hypothetical protein